MTLILFLDDRGGMLFNRRRQSQDRAAREVILRMAEGRRLLMNPYSAKQFGDATGITVTETPVKDAQGDDFAVVENLPVDDSVIASADEVVLFLWNTLYPSDVVFDYSLFTKHGFTLASQEDFAGYSHEKITIKRYLRRN